MIRFDDVLSSVNWLEKFGESALDKDSGVPTEPPLLNFNDENGLVDVSALQKLFK